MMRNFCYTVESKNPSTSSLSYNHRKKIVAYYLNVARKLVYLPSRMETLNFVLLVIYVGGIEGIPNVIPGFFSSSAKKVLPMTDEIVIGAVS